jgi:hypothetical protein
LQVSRDGRPRGPGDGDGDGDDDDETSSEQEEKGTEIKRKIRLSARPGKAKVFAMTSALQKPTQVPIMVRGQKQIDASARSTPKLRAGSSAGVQEQKKKWELLNDDSSGDNALLAFKALEITGADFVVAVEKMFRYFSRLTREQKVDVMQSVKKHIRNVMVAIPEQKLERKSGSRKKKRPKKFDEHNAKMMLTKAVLHAVFDADD